MSGRGSDKVRATPSPFSVKPKVGFSFNKAKTKAGDEKGDIEAETKVEVTEAMQAVRDARVRELELYDEENGSEYWFNVVCQTKGQRDELLAKMQVAGFFDVKTQTLDGEKLAQALGIKLLAPVPTKRRIKQVSSSLKHLVRGFSHG